MPYEHPNPGHCLFIRKIRLGDIVMQMQLGCRNPTTNASVTCRKSLNACHVEDIASLPFFLRLKPLNLRWSGHDLSTLRLWLPPCGLMQTGENLVEDLNSKSVRAFQILDGCLCLSNYWNTSWQALLTLVRWFFLVLRRSFCVCLIPVLWMRMLKKHSCLL